MNRAERRAQLRAHNRGRSFASPLSAAATRNRTVALHIDELVLHGFRLQSRHAVSEATQLELSRLLTSRGLPQFVKRPARSGRIDGGNFNVTSATKPEVVGSLLANAVYGGQWR